MLDITLQWIDKAEGDWEAAGRAANAEDGQRMLRTGSEC